MKAILCTEALFPRGDANANYVENIALALKNVGCDVYVIGKHNHLERAKTIEKFDYKGLTGITYGVDAQSGVIQKLAKNFKSGNIAKQILQDNIELERDDIVIVYSHNFIFINNIYRVTNEKKCRVATCITEDLQKTQTNFWGLLRFKIAKHFFIPMCGKVFPISNYLKEYYDSMGCKTMVLPPLVNPEEVSYCKKIDGSHINLIYPGNGTGKDSYSIMFQCLLELSAEDRLNITLHFAGFPKEKIMVQGNINDLTLQKLGKTVRIHSWMSYEELSELYMKMDYLLMPKMDSIVTRANFPSKLPELMLYGVCPITTKVGDSTKYLKDGENAFLLNECDAKSFSCCLKKILSMRPNERECMAEKARETAMNVFNYNNWGQKILDFVCEE